MGRTGISPLRIAELLIVAILGGALALGGAALLRQAGRLTTIQQVSPLAGGGLGNAALQAPPSKGLTAEQIYRQDAPGVVQITATSVTQRQPIRSTSSRRRRRRAVARLGLRASTRAGHIVTNYHVIRARRRCRSRSPARTSSPRRVVGKDPSTDIAVLKIDAHARALTPLPLGDSDAVTRRRRGATRSATRSASRAR